MRIRTRPIAGLAIATMCLTLMGCGQAGPGDKVAVPEARAEEPDAPIGWAIADPKLREARWQNDAILTELFAGKAEGADLARIAEKTKKFRAFSVKSQKMIREGAAEFAGVLSGPDARAGFRLTLVKQDDGKWAIATFSGPNPE
jgi:hypothetical protein